MNRLILALLPCLLHLAATAQSYYVKSYRVEKGLPSDIIKSCTQDSSLGYFWIATDEGLVKFDGVTFTSYREAMHSNYTKGFLTTRDGRLLAYGDLDLIEIKNTGDTVIFNRLFDVSHIANDSALSYPKLLYEDVHGNIWVSESQSVVKLQHKSFKRYSFDLANRSPQFLRSFAFFEDLQHNLFIASYQGNVFRYNVDKDLFEPVSQKLPSGIEFLSREDNNLIIGAAEGLFEGELSPQGGLSKKIKQKISAPSVSFVAALNNQKHIVATRGDKHFITDLKKNIVAPFPQSINNINHIYISHENDIWISGNEGLIMLKENLFQDVNKNASDFIESITEDTTSGVVYYATSHTLYAFDPATRQNNVVLDLPSGYFQSLLYTTDGIWVANAFNVFLLVNGKIKRQFDFSDKGRFITALTRDSGGNIWLTIPGSDFAYMIDTQYVLHHYCVPLGKEGAINMIREGNDGMYIVSPGKNSYLYFKNFSDTVFHNISVPTKIISHNDITVTDMAFTAGKLWLASSEGLLTITGQQLEHVDLGPTFTGLAVKTVSILPGSKLLTANAYGLILYDVQTGVYDLFNESCGLLSNTITPHGIFVSRKGNIWIGTAKGLCFSTHPLTSIIETPQPQFTHAYVNGKSISPHSKEEIDYGSFLSLQVSSITFPENEVTFQYRIRPGENWETIHKPEIQFSGTQAGNYTLEVRAKKNGPYSWSAPSSISFTIAQPFWQRWWFFMVCGMGALLLVVATIAGAHAYNAKKKRALQALIDERTNELKASNAELINLNLEKNNLIGIVAHDLKSPLNQITGLLTLIKVSGHVDKASASYLSMMETSASRLNAMIHKILDVDAIESKRLNLKMESVNFSEILNTVIDRYRNDANMKRISISRHIPTEIYTLVDKNFTEQVLDNLLSNAVKFSPFERTIFVTLQTNSHKVICEIKDEGPGLSDEDKKKLFGKYQKLSAKPTGNEGSTGLGLSIVKKFVEAMNGEIWCESEQGKGACFFVSFSLDQGHR